MSVSLPTPLILFVFQVVAIASILLSIFTSSWSLVTGSLVLVLGAFVGSYFVPSRKKKKDCGPESSLKAIHGTSLLNMSSGGGSNAGEPIVPSNNCEPSICVQTYRDNLRKKRPHQFPPEMYRQKKPYVVDYLTPDQIEKRLQSRLQYTTQQYSKYMQPAYIAPPSQ
jgi:hypothetical protein